MDYESRANASVIRLIGTEASAAAYELRDFLQRSVIAYEWLPIRNDDDCLGLTGKSLADAHLPVVEFPNGEPLSMPTVAELAERLGWVTHPRHEHYDLSIYGAGPAGLSAAVYAASEGLKAVLIERSAIGGQAGYSSLIENYMGFPHGISGAELAERGRQQAQKFGVEILQMREGVNARFEGGDIVVDLADGSTLTATTNICATGVEWRRLKVDAEANFLGRGLHYGAGMSEAPLCVGQLLFVVGGGNSAGQAAVHLSEFAKHVTLLVRGKALSETMSQYLCARILSHPRISVRYRTTIVDLGGSEKLERIALWNMDSDRRRWVPADRVFVCIGGRPNTEWAKDTAIIRDSAGYLVTGSDLNIDGRPPAVWPMERLPFHLETSVPGSFAVGDVRAGSVKRLATAVGEGAIAVVSVHRVLAERRA